jgi:phage terminase large subunit
MQLKAGINFQYLIENYKSKRVIVLAGGTRSGKSVAVVQFIFYYCLQNTGKEIIVARDTRTNLKSTILKDFEAVAYGDDLKDIPPMYPEFRYNRTELTANVNGNNIKFIGLNDDPLRVYGMKSDLFFINEAIGTYQSTFDQMEQRCTGFGILDCNPSLPNSWVYQLDKREDVGYFRSTFRENPFLEESIVNKILSYEPTEENEVRGTADARMWSIYGEGKTFKGKEIIYPEWSTYDEDPTEFDHLFLGQDWGWVHPAATTQVIQKGNDLYLKEVFYASYHHTEQIAEVVIEYMKDKEETYIVCDSEDQKAINKFIEMGLPAIAVKKPAGSVLSGIRKMQKYNLYIHKDSHNLQREANNYKWKVDRTTGAVLEVPVKKDDDGMDSGRYPVYTFL